MQIREILITARSHGRAVGAFNILNDLTARAVIKKAEEMGTPVILQTSMATVKAYGVKPLGSMLEAARRYSRQPVILHLDHCRDSVTAKSCLDGAWDSVMIDGSHLPFEENIQFTKEIAEYAHARGKEVEGELGVIGGVEEEIEGGEGTGISYGDCITFMKATDIDIFAPSIGTAHGVYKGKPLLRFDLVKELAEKQPNPIVVHGGSGLPPADFFELIRCGASKINISTAIKQAYLKGVRENDSLSNPLEFDRKVLEEVQKTVEEHIRIFSRS